jgi:SAM-dependent methyltransferase
MKNFWNDRYGDTEFAYGIEPNEFLVSKYSQIPIGRVLCIAEGEGRNAAYLATKGYTITAVDQSEVGLKKTKQLGNKHGFDIETIEADLRDFEIEPSSWEGIVSISAHLPPLIRKKIHHQVVSGLKPGGVLILEAYTEKQLQMAGVGGPPEDQKEMFMSLSDLKEELAGLDFIVARETDREFNEGKYHQGPSAVVQVVAKNNRSFLAH